MSELRARRETPVSWLQQKTANALMGLGFSNYGAQRQGHRVANALSALLTPLGLAEEATDYSRQFAAQAKRGQLPARPGGSAALNALAVVPAAKAGKGIIAYHGSPHKFDRFDMSKIGTGEGAQAYGHGLYFAENESVARSYRDALADMKVGLVVDGRRFTPMGGALTPEDEAARLVISMSGFDNPQARAAGDVMRADKAVSEAWASVPHNQLQNDPAEVRRVLSGWMGSKVKLDKASKGSLYQVQINADPADFLDWDAPLTLQGEGIQDAVLAAEGLPSDYSDAIRFWEARKAQETGRLVGGADREIARLRTERAARGNVTGEQIIKQLSAKQFVAGAHPLELTGKLRDAGIPGIKYLDAGSRGAGDGSRNYVVFDDKLVTILKRYGWVPGTAIPAAAAADYERETGQPVQTRPVA